MTAPPAPSGKQFVLESGDQQIVVTEVGATLRSYTVGDVAVLDGFPVAEMCSGARGQSFLPWPGRIDGGSYEFAGAEHQLPLSEPAAGNAIHGLTRWSDWKLIEDTPLGLHFSHHLPPQPGYPFELRGEIVYRLGENGLRVETRATNLGPEPCPYATGAHPYLRLGAERVDELELRLPAATRYRADDRGIPTGREPVEGSGQDFRAGRRIGDTGLDTTFTDLDRDAEGLATVEVRGPAGSAQLWLDGAYGYLQLFTGDSLPESEGRRRSLGVEPMTAAPNAFRTGDGLVTLEPGQTHTATWGLRPLLP